MNNGANALIERNLAFLQIEKLNRIMSISRAVNKASIRLKDKFKLLESICRIYRETGGYKSAVIYSFSRSNNELNTSILSENISTEDPANEIKGIDLKLLGLNINHFKQGIAFISNDITQLKDEDVRAKLFDKGIRSLGIFPLLEDSEPSAALILFSEEYNIFDLREVEAVQETAEDISYALEVLKKDEELSRLSLAVVHGPTSILITDVKGNIEYVNPRFSEITGYAPEEVIGKNPSMLKSGETKPEIYEDLWNTIKAGKIWRGELLNKDKTGKLYWVSASISPLFNEKGEIINFISIREDITERV
ncbi:MAG TPA: PAS domain-containing protein, partial [Ignavibacteriales bacterium]|nr:PAS domain-containing protein [Ignavibacteriales bacterium]